MSVNKTLLLQQLLNRLENKPDDRLMTSLQNSLLEAVEAGDKKIAFVETAVALNPSESDQLTRIITTKFPSVEDFDFSVNPQVLAGIRIRIGDELIDDTAETALDLMKKTVL